MGWCDYHNCSDTICKFAHEFLPEDFKMELVKPKRKIEVIVRDLNGKGDGPVIIHQGTVSVESNLQLTTYLRRVANTIKDHSDE